MGIESLDDLANDVNDAYEEAVVESETPLQYSTPSMRDLSDPKDGNIFTTKVDMLEAWQSLVRALYEHDVFLQYSPMLETLFDEIMQLDETKYSTIKTLVELMVSAIEYDQDKLAAECRYITLMEILSSFTDRWALSGHCKNVWDATLEDDPQGKIDAAATASPQVFRRIAYSTLMGLAWVPNSPGLREICGFDQDHDVTEQVPAVVQSIFCQIRSTPLPRHDCIHQLLNKLEGGHVTSLAICSLEDTFSSKQGGASQGLGKTTLAAMVTAHPSVQSHFCVLWLRLHHGTAGMSYKQYTGYLTLLCEQLGITTHKWPQPARSIEEGALREKRQEEQMYQCKREMSSLLGKATTKNVLLVLDDVQDDLQIEWFWFQNNQSLLVTTEAQSLSVDWTLEMEMLTEDEALELFLTEADYPPNHVLSSSLEAKSIVHRCAYHPLTIRTVARWFRLKQVTAGVVKGLEELNHELSSCTAKLRHSRSKNISPSKILSEVMNLMLSPVLAAGGQPTTLMKMCLSSMALVFPQQVPVPTEAVHLLWGQLLRTEPDAIHELGDALTTNQLRKRVRFISEALSSLGLLSMTEKKGVSYVEIHHGMQAQYAVDSCREMQFSASPKETIRRWHEAFSAAYLAKKVESDRDGVEDKCRAYALEFLLFHMLSAGMFQKVAVLLRDDRFLAERIKYLGWTKGLSTHIDDCLFLRNCMQDDTTVEANPNEVITVIYSKIGSMVADHVEKYGRKDEAARGMHLIGYALAEMGRYSEATQQYRTALKMVPKSSAFSGTLLFSLSTVFLARNDTEKALKNVNECIKVMNDCAESNPLYAEALILKADALLSQCDYRGAMEFYDLALEKLYADSANNRVNIGVALGRKGRLYYTMGELDNAYGTFEECLKWKEKLDESSCDLASVYNYMGDICMERGNRKDALLLFDQAYRMFEFHRTEADETDIHIINGKTDDLNQDFDGCHENFQLALESIRKNQRPTFERTAYDLRVMGRTYVKNGDEEKAILVYNDCLLQTANNADTSLERSAALFDMGVMYHTLQQTEVALQRFQQSLKIRILKLGESPTVIATLLKIGNLHRDANQLDDAASFVNKALELTERVYGEEDDRVGDVLYAVADIKFNMNEDVEALAMFAECLEFRRKQHTRPHPHIADALEGLGKVHMKNGNYEKSYQCLVEALDIRQGTMASDDPDIATTFHLIGQVARKGGDCERALHFLLDSLHIRKTLRDQSYTVKTLAEIGHVHRQLHDDLSALGCYEKCVEILIDNYGTMDPRLVEVYLPLGHVKKQQGIMDEAKECYESSLKIAKQTLGDDNIRTAAAFRSLGLVEFEAQNYVEALDYLGAFVKIQESNKVKNTADYILALLLIGDINRYNCRTDEATSAFASANHAFAASKEVAKKYPGFGPILHRRLSEENKPSIPPPASGLFARITGELGRLSDEVKTTSAGIKSDEDEIELRNSILLDD